MHCVVPVAGTIFLTVVFLSLVAITGLCIRFAFWVCAVPFWCSRKVFRCAAGRGPAPVPAPRPPATPPRQRPQPERPSVSIALILVLLLFCLAFFGFQQRSRHESFERRRTKAADSLKTQDRKPAWTLTGYGQTNADAEQVALDQAYGRVLAYVREEMPGATWWTPSPEYVRKHLVKSVRVEQPRDLPQLQAPAQGVTLSVEVTSADRQDILRRGRMLFLGKVLVALVLILATLAAYIRVDERTKGFYTAWLRLGAATIVLAVLVGLASSGVVDWSSWPVMNSVQAPPMP